MKCSTLPKSFLLAVLALFAGGFFNGLGAQVVKQMGPATTGAQLSAAMGDMTIDTIELLPGTYHTGQVYPNGNRSSRPLTVRPQSAGSVIFSGGGGSSGVFYFGMSGRRPTNMTVQGIIFDNFNISDTGLIWLGNCDRISVNSITIRNSKGNPATPANNHGLYLSSDAGVGPSNVVANGWNFDGGNRFLTALHSFHNPNARGVTAVGWSVRNARNGILISSDISGLNVDGWTFDSCDRSVYATSGTGAINNCRASNCGVPTIPASIQQSNNNWSASAPIPPPPATNVEVSQQTTQPSGAQSGVAIPLLIAGVIGAALLLGD